MAKISGGMLQGIVIVLVMATVLFSLAPTLMHTAQIGIQSLGTELTNSTLYGTGPAGLSANLYEWSGYFWLVAVIGLVFAVTLGIFKRRR